jgi:hypothetical protein
LASANASFTTSYSGFTAEAQAAFQHAVDLWSQILQSPVPIAVDAQFASLDSGVLGQAGASEFVTGFTGAPVPDAYYPEALAEALNGTNLNGTDSDVFAAFNSDRPDWYFGTDGNPPPGQYDFVSVVLHELGHGLGFVGSMSVDPSLSGSWWGPTAYDLLAEDAQSHQLVSAYSNPSMALGSALRSNALSLDGPAVDAYGGPAKLYAPSSWMQGSSFSHFDEATYPRGSANSLMTPSLGAGEAIHDPGLLVRGAFADMGWAVNQPVDSGRYTALAPARILDTRSTTPLGPGESRDVQITGMGGIPVSGVSAVVMNVTATGGTANGDFLTVFPSGTTRPTASNLNFNAGQTVPNLVTVKVGPGGKVSVYNQSGSTDVLFDVAGYYGNVPTGNDGRYQPLTPARILDTRATTPLGPAQNRDIQVTGVGGVPASGVSAVVLNVTVTGPTANGDFLTAYPAGTTRPTASNLNFNAGQTVANRVIVKVGSGGKVSVYNQTGSTHVILDVGGWFTDSSIANGAPGPLTALTPARIVDTRAGAPVAAGETRAIQVDGLGGVPASGVSAVVLNVTVTQPTANGGFIKLYPSGAAAPTVSDINFNAGQTVPNLVIVKVGPDGKVNLFNQSGTTHVIFDVVGWFG